MSIVARTRPLVAVVCGVPLFLEALVGAFDGIADIQGLHSGDAGLEGLLLALQPDAVIAQAQSAPDFDLDVPMVHVDLEGKSVGLLVDGEWRRDEVELSGEAIRNMTLHAMHAGAVR